MNITICYHSNHSSTDCCLDYITSQSIPYRIVQSSHVISGIVAIIASTFYIIILGKKHILPVNTKIFVFLNLFFIQIHSFALSLFHIHHLIKSLIISPSDACSIRNSSSFCSWFRYPYSFCFFSLVINQFFLFVDRLLETFCDNYQSFRRQFMIAAVMTELSLTSFIEWFVYRKAREDEMTLSCINIPPSIQWDVNMYTAWMIPFDALCVLLSIILFYIHKNKVNRSRYDLSRHYRAAMNRNAYSFLQVTTLTQSIIILLYPITITIVRLNKEYVPIIIHNTISNAAYLISYQCAIVPLVMIHSVRTIRKTRKEQIKHNVAVQSVGEAASDQYFRDLAIQWQSVPLQDKISN